MEKSLINMISLKNSAKTQTSIFNETPFNSNESENIWNPLLKEYFSSSTVNN